MLTRCENQPSLGVRGRYRPPILRIQVILIKKGDPLLTVDTVFIERESDAVLRHSIARDNLCHVYQLLTHITVRHLAAVNLEQTR